MFIYALSLSAVLGDVSGTEGTGGNAVKHKTKRF